MKVYYYTTFDIQSSELIERTFTNFSEASKNAIEDGILKIRDNMGNEYYL